ncbi:MAG: N-acetyl-gamma-glutamyl-phosphate reductase [uncultured Acidimicrobiales bacterium]|uniref:N-acetyl-gamma-glutamyl-phosphate reductase n=1 Tax=uncultured Acidimicrobiales bacterium TaxID=310071 RepID=A0A6J4IN19_9ACTN|nr:MAG: N-acetyl-gamma-glutamyl-phosphate reductase [uncultured Acidimicrobiales bacterium]
MITVGIAGASGYTGAELLRLCASHPDLTVKVATGDSQAGTRAAALYPSLAAAYPDLVFSPYDAAAFEGVDLVFLALPHGASQSVVPELRTRVKKIVDLSADFRLADAALYPEWYGADHTAPELLDEFAFGIPELFRDSLRGADLVAAAGCYPTSAALALAPLLQAGMIESTGIIVDAASGVSGAGKGLKATSLFGTVDENFNAYGLLDHRHTPEIEQALGGAQVLFTPHLAPMTRGILATCYARPTSGSPDPLAVLRDAYADEPFVVVTDEPPQTKATLGSNCIHITARHDPRTGWVLVLAALDNLVKGASGQAVQCANLALGLEESAGLPIVGVYP